MAAALFLLATLPAVAQVETLQVTKQGEYGEREEFEVLKTDKKVRQGPYVRYLIVPGPRNEIKLLETGAYVQGQKSGDWHTFVERPRNRLASKGSY